MLTAMLRGRNGVINMCTHNLQLNCRVALHGLVRTHAFLEWMKLKWRWGSRSVQRDCEELGACA